jgi:hypothetical protein
MKQILHLSLIRILCWPRRFPRNSSSRLPGGTRKSCKDCELFSMMSLCRAWISMLLKRGHGTRLNSACVSLCRNDLITLGPYYVLRNMSKCPARSASAKSPPAEAAPSIPYRPRSGPFPGAPGTDPPIALTASESPAMTNGSVASCASTIEKMQAGLYREATKITPVSHTRRLHSNSKNAIGKRVLLAQEPTPNGRSAASPLRLHRFCSIHL